MTLEVAEEPPQKAPYPGGGKPSKDFAGFLCI